MITNKEFWELGIGDILMHVTGQAYMVTEIEGPHVTLVRTVTMTDSKEWTVFSKAQHIPPQT